MTVHVHDLAGCTPTPLGFYLKALGVLRLVAEQADPAARGWWRDERFWLATKLDRADIERFFLERYEPSPILSPWNLGSGFYYDEDPPLTVLAASRASRFALFRDAIEDAREATREFAQAIRHTKDLADRIEEVKKALKARRDESLQRKLAKLEAEIAKAERAQKALKESLVGVFRRRWRGSRLRWFDAAVVLDAEGSPLYPALLGTGGNDGRLDFTNNNMQHLARLFDLASEDGKPTGVAARELRSSLFGSPSPGLERAAVGQFSPGRAGGANMASGFEGRSLVNSWDFVLMLEGSLSLASGAGRRMESAAPIQAAAPFAVRSRAAGYSAAAAADESARGEQWMPLWSAAATSAEVESLMREGRARVGRDPSATPVDFARAVARLGVARGIEAFERYGYIERNGQANLAVPLGRWHVAAQPHQRLLDEIDRWLHVLRRAARDDKSPGAWQSAARLCDEAVLAVCRNGRVASRWQRLLLALAAAEQALVSSPRRTVDQGVRPIPPLSPEWVRAADDGGPEVRLAVALASQHAGWPSASHPVREHWTPIDGSGLRFASDAKSIAIGSDVVCTGVDLERDCVALVRRRVLRARSAWKAEEGRPLPIAEALPLVAPWACSARLGDIDAFLSRATDDARVLGLARAFMAVRWREWGDKPLERGGDPAPPNALHAIFRLVHLPHGLRRGDDQVPIAVDPEVGTRLAAGNLAAAASAALRRLRASGLRPVVRAIAGDAALARRVAASLAFALHPTDVARAADAVTKPYELEAS